jgi:hypothetical protein
MTMAYTLRQKLGAALIDWPVFEWRLRSRWILIHNRDERLVAAPGGEGVWCDWRWTTDLHAAKVFPSLGRRLMRRSLDDWPIGFAHDRAEAAAPRVSFVIGHRGEDRIPQLLATVATLAAQRDVGVECIVVEQSVEPMVQRRLPGWVRYVHTPPSSPDSPYSRAWALNCGVRAATGEVVVLHDGDLLVPQAYAARLWHHFQSGFEVVNLKRFLFYLDEADSRRAAAELALDAQARPAAVMQNALGGGSIAVSREAYLAIGGYDESFQGWGGEDNEFWERAGTLRMWPYGYLPMAHLWHAPQPGKAARENPNLARYEALSKRPVAERIATLSRRPFGDRARMAA